MSDIEPIKRMQDIESIYEMLLKENKRNFLLFCMGISNALISDLLRLKMQDVFLGCEGPNTLKIFKEKNGLKTERRLCFLFDIESEIKSICSGRSDTDYLFQSRKGENSGISTRRATVLIKSWCDGIGLKGNFGAHTLRKTWAYHIVTSGKYKISKISKMMNHKNTKYTKKYLFGD